MTKQSVQIDYGAKILEVKENKIKKLEEEIDTQDKKHL